MPKSSSELAAEYRVSLEERRAASASEDNRRKNLERLLAAIFIASLAIGLEAFGTRRFSPWWILVPAVVFTWVNARLGASHKTYARLQRAVNFYELALARLGGSWAGLGDQGDRFVPPDHLYARDLDIFGHGSIFELMCAARTEMGKRTLAAWLLAPSSREAVEARQRAVADLAPQLGLREDLAVLANEVDDSLDAESLTSWAEHGLILKPSRLEPVFWIVSASGAVAALAIFVYILAQTGILELTDRMLAGLRIYVALVIAFVAPIRWRFKARTDQILTTLEAAAGGLTLFADVLFLLERCQFNAPLLVKLRADLDSSGPPASRSIANLRQLKSLSDSRHHRFMPILGPLLLWDLHLSHAVEAWRRNSGQVVRRWISAVAELESISSLAGYAYEHPNHVFPELSGPSPSFEAEALAHPLLPDSQSVANDVYIGHGQRLLIVSGSNMSGKSTLLRAIGATAVIAQAGGPVRARRVKMSPLAVGGSIHAVDSLQEGISRFYAEILRLRRILEQAKGPAPVLFLLDELLHGTNSDDRLSGSEAIARGLLERGAIGLITTHDLALTAIAARPEFRATNVHFDDHLEDGRLCFDYQMRPGIVEKSNAIELMRSVGLDL